MFSSDFSQVIEVVKVFCNLSKNLLLSHKTELLVICNKLHTTPVTCTNTEPLITNYTDQNPFTLTVHHSNTHRLTFITNYANWNLFTPIIHHSTYLNTYRPITAHLNHKALPLGLVQNLVKRLNKNLETIEKTFFNINHKHKPAWMINNSCIVDLVMPKSNQSSTTQFWKGLSQQFLTVEFDVWKQNNYSIFKMNKSMNKGINLFWFKYISEFCKVNRDWFETKKRLFKKIEYEVKLLMCEK